LNTSSCVEHEGEEGVISTPFQAGSVDRGEQGREFGVLKVVDGLLGTATLERDRQNGMNLLGFLRIATANMGEEGMYRGKANVAGLHAVVPFLLEMVEKRNDSLRCDILKIECRWVEVGTGAEEAE
jgi:hypothetical protein